MHPTSKNPWTCVRVCFGHVGLLDGVIGKRGALVVTGEDGGKHSSLPSPGGMNSRNVGGGKVEEEPQHPHSTITLLWISGLIPAALLWTLRVHRREAFEMSVRVDMPSFTSEQILSQGKVAWLKPWMRKPKQFQVEQPLNTGLTMDGFAEIDLSSAW